MKYKEPSCSIVYAGSPQNDAREFPPEHARREKESVVCLVKAMELCPEHATDASELMSQALVRLLESNSARRLRGGHNED